MKARNLVEHAARVHSLGAPAPPPRQPRRDAGGPGVERVLREMIQDYVATASQLASRGWGLEFPEELPREMLEEAALLSYQRLLGFRYHALRRRLGLGEVEVMHGRKRIVARRTSWNGEVLADYWLREAEFAEAYRILSGGRTDLRLQDLKYVEGQAVNVVADVLGVAPGALRELARERPDILRVERGMVRFDGVAYAAMRPIVDEITDAWEEAERLYDTWGRGYDLEEGPWPEEQLRDLGAVAQVLQARGVQFRAAPVELNEAFAVASIGKQLKARLERQLSPAAQRIVELLAREG